MKIIDKEEKEAHAAHIAAEGLKGMLYGSAISLGLFTYLRVRHPQRFASFNTSIKACILVMPTISLAAFYADEGSVEFDREMYSAGHANKQMMEEYRQWRSMPFGERVVSTLSTHKYKIIFGSWLASMYGLWVFVNRDKVMTAQQKFVQARMYAQALTIVLLLGTIALSVKETELNKDKPKAVPEWKRVLEEREAEERELAQHIQRVQAGIKELEESDRST